MQPLDPQPPNPTDDAESSGRLAAQNILRDLLRLRGLGALLLVAVMISSVWTIQRNQAWQNAGTLWQDIAEKLWHARTLDPNTGIEVPRFERARIYNNIGLFLYRKAKQLAATRQQLQKMAASLALINKNSAAGQNALAKNRAEIEQAIRKFRSARDTLNRELLARVPAEFTAQLLRENITPNNHSWEPLRPAEICYQRSIYHRPNWAISRLNYSLIFRLRREGLARSDDAWFRCIMLEDIHLRHALTLNNSLPKSLFQHSQTLFDLGNYWLEKKANERALIAFITASDQGERALALTIRHPQEDKQNLSRFHISILNAYLGQANALAALKRYTEAIEVLEAIQKKVPPSSSQPIRDRLRSIRAEATAAKQTNPTAHRPEE